MIVGRSRIVGFLALATFVAAIGLPLVAPSHGFGDDIDVGWGEQPLSFGGAVTKIGSAHAPRTNEHCALCHWARALRATVTADSIRCSPPLVIGAALVSRSTSCASDDLAKGAPRGPPASL